MSDQDPLSRLAVSAPDVFARASSQGQVEGGNEAGQNLHPKTTCPMGGMTPLKNHDIAADRQKKKQSNGSRRSKYQEKILALGGSFKGCPATSNLCISDESTNYPQPAKVFCCNICKKTFTQAGTLRSHQRRHTDEKPFPCTTVGCEKAFRTQSDRARHVKTHTGIKTHKCDQCSCMFSNSANLNTHKNVVHLNVRKYKCETCQKTFGYLTNFRNHLRCHTGERPYVCQQAGCDQTFAEYSTALQHALNYHVSRGSYKCGKCDNVYRSPSGLAGHVKVIHERVRVEEKLPPQLPRQESSGLASSSHLRDLLLQELPMLASLIRNTDPHNRQSALEDEREAAILLGFHEEETGDAMLGQGNPEHIGQLPEVTQAAADPVSDWTMDCPHSRDLDLFPELATDCS